VVVLRHLSKSGGTNAVYRGGGSIGIIGAARAGMLVAPDPEDENRRVLAMTKSNLAAMPAALAYRLVEDELRGVARVQWDGTTTYVAADLLGTSGPEERSALTGACEFLLDLLADGPVPQAQVRAAAERTEWSWATVRRAKDRLGIRSQKVGQPGTRGEWRWILPLEGAHEDAEDAEDAHDQGLSTFGNLEHLRPYEPPAIAERGAFESQGVAVAMLRAEVSKRRIAAKS
jgi:hypothetical protein